MLLGCLVCYSLVGIEVILNLRQPRCGGLKRSTLKKRNMCPSSRLAQCHMETATSLPCASLPTLHPERAQLLSRIVDHSRLTLPHLPSPKDTEHVSLSGPYGCLNQLGDRIPPCLAVNKSVYPQRSKWPRVLDFERSGRIYCAYVRSLRLQLLHCHNSYANERNLPPSLLHFRALLHLRSAPGTIPKGNCRPKSLSKSACKQQNCRSY